MNDISKISRYLADNLIELRHKKNFSQSQLASLAEIPRSTLTNLESGSGNPSLQNLAKISTALQVGIEELLSRPRNECELVPAGQVPHERRANGRVKVFKLVPDKVKGLDVDRIEIEPGATMGGHPHLTGAKEYFTVLNGEITISVAGEKFIVKRGDVFAFPGDQSHSYRNTGSTQAAGISIIIPVAIT